MVNSLTYDQVLKDALKSAKTIAMVGVSSIKKEDLTNLKRRPSIIVMKYLQEFGYRVIPVNPFAAGTEINGEIAAKKLEEISTRIDIVNVFRPSKETPGIAEEAIKIGAKVIWLQYGIQSQETKNIADKIITKLLIDSYSLNCFFCAGIEIIPLIIIIRAPKYAI